MIRKTLASAGVFVLLAGGIGFAAVQSASAAPVKPKAIGMCAKTTGGATRTLEPNNLRRSQYGKCKTGERRVLVPTVDGLPKAGDLLPVKVQFTFEGVTAVCTKGVDVAGVPAYACVKPVPAP